MEPHELVVAETDLRAAEAEVEWGLTAENHRTRLASLNEPPDGDADEDRRLLDRAYAAAVIEPGEVLERQRHALIRAAAAVATHVVGAEQRAEELRPQSPG